ncbi:hypothetical protein C8R44DRAFT_51227 [Mycena epipterygia]|nr:hypothetical protein C8R44DRAFT_51227 [Mycena epipterygia]
MNTTQPRCTKCGFEPEQNAESSGSVPTTHPLPSRVREIQRARLAQLDKQLTQIKTYLITVEAERQAVQDDLDTIVYPVLTVPNEITSNIFVHCLPDQGRVWPSAGAAPLLLAQICRHWRDIALSTGELWASVAFNFGNPYMWYGEALLPGPSSNYKCASQIIAAWFPRAAGRPLSLAIRCDHDSSAKVPPEVFTSIPSFRTQLCRLELSLPSHQFQELNELGGSFPRIHHLSLSLSDGTIATTDVTTAFQDTPSLRELCLGRGISLFNLNVDPQISLVLTMLELWEPISLTYMLSLVQRFPKL